MSDSEIYLDHNATTPVRPEVVEAMVEVMDERSPGNPSSQHRAGQRARAVLERARDRVAAVLGVDSSEIVFTSGATESNQLAIAGVLESWRERESGRVPRIVTAALEHASVLTTLEALERKGEARVDRVNASPGGRVEVEALLERVQPGETALVILQGASGETGVIQPVAELAPELEPRGIPVLGDLSQVLGKAPVDLSTGGPGLASFSAHKVEGPPGVGVLRIRSGVPFRPPLPGVSQEGGRRGGTVNLPGIVGLARAFELADPGHLARQTGRLRDELRQRLVEGIPGLRVNGEGESVLPNTLNVSVVGTESEMLLIRLDLIGIQASAGSACASGAREPSHVLRAMGLEEERIRSAIRLSLGRTTTADDVDRASRGLIEVARELVG